MDLSHVTYQGPEFDASSPVVELLPANLVDLLKQINGFVQFGGGLHVRGVCVQPNWHSLAEVMLSSEALHRGYRAVLPTDVPFAQDCVADQFLLREGFVYRLASETGELERLNLKLSEFFTAVEADPVKFLAMEPLLRFQKDGGTLQPGEVLHAYPPFCTKEAANGVSLKAVGTAEALRFLADFSRQISGLAGGDKFHVRVVP